MSLRILESAINTRERGAGSLAGSTWKAAGRPPTSAHSRARYSAVSGLSSAGLRMTLQPAASAGATLLTGGRTEGLTVWPTVLADVPREALAVSEETFGPLAPLIPFGSEEEAVQLANRGQAGLAAYVWTRDLRRTLLTSEALEFGIVGVNDGVPSTANAPFGGVKFSGLGREGGHEGIAEYLETKFVSIDLP